MNATTNATGEPPSDGADLLYGVPAIAAHMGIRPRQVHHQIDKGGLPVFRIGGVICLRPSRLVQFLAEREAAGRPGSAAS